jgi:hypothetical protein
MLLTSRPFLSPSSAGTTSTTRWCNSYVLPVWMDSILWCCALSTLELARDQIRHRHRRRQPSVARLLLPLHLLRHPLAVFLLRLLLHRREYQLHRSMGAQSYSLAFRAGVLTI